MKVIKILLIEDDQLDAINMKRTLDKMKIVYSLHVASNGEEGLAYLHSLGNEVLPDVVLIDINMPKMNGLEFLAAVRASER
jgi:CheY-like chemotaxis protein